MSNVVRFESTLKDYVPVVTSRYDLMPGFKHRHLKSAGIVWLSLFVVVLLGEAGRPYLVRIAMAAAFGGVFALIAYVVIKRYERSRIAAFHAASFATKAGRTWEVQIASEWMQMSNNEVQLRVQWDEVKAASDFPWGFAFMSRQLNLIGVPEHAFRDQSAFRAFIDDAVNRLRLAGNESALTLQSDCPECQHWRTARSFPCESCGHSGD